MDFTYSQYTYLINLLKRREYNFANYENHCDFERAAIFRHDIDNSLDKALVIASIEKDNDIKSTFFILLSTDFYNIFSRKSANTIREIQSYGHEIGLHFDEKRYDVNNEEELRKYIEYEKMILEQALGTAVKTVSMHRPSRWILDNDIEFDYLINSYSNLFLREFKYLSDSRMHWREDVIGIIKSEEYKKLHILTHPFWYDRTSSEIKGRVKHFIKSAREERYYSMKENIRDLEDIVGLEVIK